MNKAFVINLDSKPEQFQEVQQAFLPYGIECERFAAVVDKKKEIGKTLGFLSLIERAKKEHWPWVMILEDDCVPLEGINAWPIISSYLLKNKKRWDLFLGGGIYIHPLKIETQFQNVANNPSNMKIDLVECKGSRLYHFSIFNQNSYDAVLAWHQLPWAIEERPTLDCFISESGLKTWTPVPFLAWQKVHDGIDYSLDVPEQKLFHFSKEIKKSFKYRFLHRFVKAIG